jgi:hypothetical protein
MAWSSSETPKQCANNLPHFHRNVGGMPASCDSGCCVRCAFVLMLSGLRVVGGKGFLKIWPVVLDDIIARYEQRKKKLFYFFVHEMWVKRKKYLMMIRYFRRWLQKKNGNQRKRMDVG